jgi:two-component system, cell cycle sensor histidine kinase and response regulator CckA
VASTDVGAERTIRDSEAKFRALAEASPAAIFIAQHDRITYANPMLATLTEYESDELIGMAPVALLRPSDDPRVPASEVRVQTRSGEERWLDLTTAAIVYDGGPAVVGTGIDITDRKRLERRMHQGQRLEAIGRLAGGVAHDFNNLLLVISGETERLLAEMRADDPMRASAEAIGRAAERAAALTEQLLAFGRRQTLIARPVDVNQVVADLEPLIRDAVGPRSRVVLELARNLPPVRVDRARLDQVFVNLVANARDAMGRRRGALTITTDLVTVDDAMREGRAWLPGGTWVRMQVADTGPGIAPDVLPHVFEPFFSTKSAAPGIGLGLSTAYGIVKQSGGYVWIESDPGSGARAVILLPPAETVPEEVPTAAALPTGQPQVLLVDDEEGVRELLGTVLERNGFVVQSAASAEAALQILSNASFDVLLTDIVLPGMTGIELARRVLAQAPRTRVLFISGYTGDAVLDAADLGAAPNFIQKPFGSRVLVARLRSLLAEDQA